MAMLIRRLRSIGPAIAVALVLFFGVSGAVMAQEPQPGAQPARTTPAKPARSRTSPPRGVVPPPSDQPQTSPEETTAPPPALPPPVQEHAEPHDATKEAVGRDETGRVRIDPELQKRIDEMLKQDAARQGGEPPAGGVINPPTAQPATADPNAIPAPGTPTPDSMKTPAQRAAERRRARNTGADGATAPGAQPTPGAQPAVFPQPVDAGGAETHSETTVIQIEPEPDPIPAKDRKYGFSIKNGTYEQLIKGFAHQTGLGVLGEAPKDGVVTFETNETLTFPEALSRIRMLLFNYKPHEPYWMLDEGTHLRVIRVPDFYRIMPLNRMYRSIEEFEAAKLSDDEIALVIYTPKTGSIADLRQVRDFLPDYVRITPMEDGSSVSIFALVSDIKKYMELIERLRPREGGDPRVTERFDVVNITASQAVDRLRQMADLDNARAGAMPAGRVGRGAASAQPNLLDQMSDPLVVIIPDDAMGYILVRAMPNKIAEIRKLLPFVDVAVSTSPFAPVVVPVQHADAGELVAAIQQVLSASSGPSPTGAAPPAAPSPRRNRRTPGAPTAAVPVSADSITLFPHPTQNAILVMADEAGVKRVRELVTLFDLKSIKGPIRIQLEVADASEVVSTVLQVLGGGGGGGPKGAAPSPEPFQLVPDPSGTAIWYSGTEADLAVVQELIKTLDVPGSTPKLHIVNLVYQTPSFVADILRQFDGAAPQSAAPADAGRRPKTRRVTANQSVSKFTPDDAKKKLYILCSADDFGRYQEIIKTLDQAEAVHDPFIRVELSHIDSAQAAEKLASLMPQTPVNQDIRTIAVDGAVLFVGATPSDLAIIETVLAEIDKPSQLIHRTFVVRHADPGDIKVIIESLLGEGASDAGMAASRSRRRSRNIQPATMPDGAGVGTGSADVSASGELTITQVGNQLIVKATPSMLDRVAALITEFDVPSSETDMRVYSDFSHNSDILGISETLASVFATGNPSPRGVPSSGRGGPRFIPQPASNRLVVMAETSQFAEIEKLLSVLRVEQTAEASIVEFIEVKHANPSNLVEEIRPLLDLKIRGLVEAGEIFETPAESTTPTTVPRPNRVRRLQQGGAASGGGEKYHIAADTHNERIVVAAPKRIVDEARTLIAMFDVPASKATLIMRNVELVNSTPAEMVKAVREMIGKPGAAPRRPTAAKPALQGGASPASPASVSSENLGGDGLVVMEAPGGAAVLLRGTKADVDQAEEWIHQLDGMSTSGRSIKLFVIENADLGMLFDLIVSVVETAPTVGRAPAAATPRRAGASGKSTKDEEDEFATTRTHASASTYMHADLIKKTLLVATNASKLKEIEALVNQFETDEEISKSTNPTYVPKFIYKLENADATDARWDLEDLFESIWDGDKPKVEKLFQDSLVIRFPDESRFDEIRGLIREHIDKPKETDLKVVRKSFVPPPGLSPEATINWIRQKHPEWDFETVDLGVGKEQPTYDIEQVRPMNPATNGNTAPLKDPGKRPTEGAARPSGNDRAGAAATPRGFLWGFQCIADAVAMAALAQDPPGEEPAGEEPAEIEPHPEEVPVYHEPVPQPAPAGNLGDRMIREAVSPLLQPKQPEDSKPVSAEERDSRKDSRKKKRGARLIYDNNQGVYWIEGGEEEIDELEESLDDLDAERDDILVPPDIRIYRVRYIDVFTAQDIIEEMFNATKSMQANFAQQQAQQAAMMRAQQQQQALAAARAAQQGARGGQQEGGREGARPGIPNQQQPPQMQQMQMPQLPAPAVRVYPNPRDRTLILRAETSQYPHILELLATIDQPRPVNAKTRTFQLKRVSATEMEQMLRETLRLDEAGAKSRSSRVPAAPGGAGPATSPGGALPETILQETFTGNLLGVDPQDITLFSSETANTIMAVAPPAALDYIGQLIEQFESGDIPERITRFYLLEFASATEVAAQLDEYFASKNPRGTGGGRSRNRRDGGESPAMPASGSSGGINSPSFIAYDRLNQLTVHGTQEQIDEVEKVLLRLDVASEEETWQDVVLAYADAKVVADTLSEMFGGSSGAGSVGAPGRPGGRSAAAQSGGGAKFIGEAGGRMVLFSAPKARHPEILSAIAKIEANSQQSSKPRVIELKNAVPTQVAEAIEKAYDVRRSGGSQGGSAQRTPRFTITAHDPSRRVFVVADDEMFKQIESLITSLDIPGAGMSAEFRIYPLKFANAKAVHGQMTKLMAEYIQRLGSNAKNMEAFSVQPDDTANALIVLGSPSVFGFIEENLRKIDTPASKASTPEIHVVQLKNADPDAVARALSEIYVRNAAKLPDGEASISVSAASASKAIVIRANAVDFARMQATIGQLDNEEVATAGEVRVVTINYGDASEIKTALESYLAKPTAGGSRSSQLIGDVRLAVMAQTNSIMLSGDRETLDRLEGIARGMDIAGEKGSVPQIIPLKFASASLVVPALRETFSDPKFGGGRKNYAPPVIVADEGSNALIVRAAPQELAAIEGFVAKIDIEGKTDKSGPRIVQVAPGINIEDLATQIEESVNESAKARMGNAKGATVPSIIAIPNLRTNTITLAGSAMLFDEAEAMIKALEKMGPAGGKTTVVIGPKNIATQDLQRLIDQLTQQQGGSGRRSGSSSGSSQRPRSGR